MNSNKKIARILGLLYLVIAVVAPFGMLYIPSNLVVPGDAATTANNIIASESLFRIGLVSDSVVFLVEIVLVALLYVLFRPINRTLSLVAAFSRLAMTVVQGVNLLNHLFPLLLLGGADYLAVFEPDQLYAFVLLFLNAHEYVAYIWGAFFGLHCLFLGYLLFKSGYFPRVLGIVLGILLVCGSLSYLIDSLGNFLFFDFNATVSMVFLIPGTIGELILTFWLLLKGVKVPEVES